jgi:superfamily II DNA or RNA helicase
MSAFIGFKLKASSTKKRRGVLPGCAANKKASIDAVVLRTKPFGKKKGVVGAVVKGLYNVPKKHLRAEQLDRFRTELTLVPKESSVGGKRVPYRLFSESTNWFRMPRFYGISRLGLPNHSLLTDGKSMHAPLVSKVKPRPYQIKPIETIVNIFQQKGPGCGALLEADCGTGKTFQGIEIARRLGRRTAVVVNKGDLQAQFMERIHDYCPDATVGIVRRDQVETDNDFVIFMAQSIGRYSPDVFQGFGLLIVDECHHWVAETLSKTLSKFPARCVLGLTATPDRRDGCGFALPYFFGPTTVRMKRIGQSVQVKVIKIPCGKAKEIFGRNGKPILPRTVTMMTEDERRNERIVTTVLALRNEGRYVIVLGERRKHLGVLREILQERAPCPVGLYVGETSKKRIAIREAEKDSPILLATVRMAEEGLDIARLDTLVLITPKSNITQAVGRIQRTHPDKKLPPLIVDFYDTYAGGAIHGMARARQRYYEKNKFTMV